MVPVLNPADLQSLQRVQTLLQSGEGVGAIDAFEALASTTQAHPNGLLVRAMILQSFGKLPEARATIEEALVLAPDWAALHNIHGNLLDDLGEGEGAVRALQRAVELSPGNNDYLINLGIVAGNAGQFDVAEKALQTVIRAAPLVPRAWNAFAHVEQLRGRAESAAQLYRRALDIDPDDIRSRHNLASVLRAADESVQALAVTEPALAAQSMPVETAALHAHLLADVGQLDQAVRAYRDIVRHVPEMIDAHETLARLLPQLGRGSEALDSYRTALAARPAAAELWASALRTAYLLNDYPQLAEWAQQAERSLGYHPEIRTLRAAALARLGQRDEAIDTLRRIVAHSPDLAAAHQHLAFSLIAVGDPAAAEAHALRATELDARDQAPWSLLSIIWRLLNDPREEWLADYERLVMPIDLDAAPGFFPDLAARLTELHIMREHPAEQSLRGGTQTRGHLFDRKDPMIQRLVGQINAGVQHRLRQLPDDPSHPFLSRKSNAISFPASWSVRLRSEGFHVSHIHQTGWMSSALYVSLPPEVGQGDAGALAFGVPDAALGLDLAPRRIERPQVGRLVVFPSYLWHGTLPFESDQPRLTVAFDALPA